MFLETRTRRGSGANHGSLFDARHDIRLCRLVSDSARRSWSTMGGCMYLYAEEVSLFLRPSPDVRCRYKTRKRNAASLLPARRPHEQRSKFGRGVAFAESWRESRPFTRRAPVLLCLLRRAEPLPRSSRLATLQGPRHHTPHPGPVSLLHRPLQLILYKPPYHHTTPSPSPTRHRASSSRR